MSADKLSIKLLYLNTKDHNFCMRLEDVERLFLLMEIQPVPQSPDYLAGLMNLYGEAVPVVDLALLIGIEHNDNYSIQTPLILVGDGEKKTALIIDNIEGVREINNSQLRGEKLFQSGEAPISASITSSDGTALLLDISKILDFDLNVMGVSLSLGKELLSLCQMHE